MTRSQLIVQRDGTIVLTPGDNDAAVSQLLRECAQLKAIVAGSQVYELSPIALWGYAARGGSGDDLLRALSAEIADPIPATMVVSITRAIARYGVLRLSEQDGLIWLSATIREPFESLGLSPEAIDGRYRSAIGCADIGRVRLESARGGWLIRDERVAEPPKVVDRFEFGGALRPYQHEAVARFLRGRNGLILLPCGAGKTVVGVAIAAQVGGPVLVVVPSRAVAAQWRTTFGDLTSIAPEDIAINRAGRRLSIVTYHTASGRSAGDLLAHDWRLVIFDEVQSLPADTFRLAAQIRADFRLGLTATLVREDGREREIAALVGPPLYDVSWRALERQGWIAPARCVEVRLPLAPNARDALRYRISIVERLLAGHASEPTLVIGSRLASLRATGERLGFPVVTGRDGPEERERMLMRFRAGDVHVLGLSRIGSVGIDLPDASVLIQLSGTFGSRQEEAQRLGRILRPSVTDSAHFYTIVESGTREVGDAQRRQRFLVDQGYSYEVVDAASIARPERGYVTSPASNASAGADQSAREGIH